MAFRLYMLHLTNVTILDTLYPAHQIAPTSTIAGGQLASLNIFPEYASVKINCNGY